MVCLLACSLDGAMVKLSILIPVGCCWECCGIEPTTTTDSQTTSRWDHAGKDKRHLADATALVGTCLDMCPEKERYDREEQRDLSVFEILAGTENPRRGEKPKVDHNKAVKKYARSAAFAEAATPEMVGRNKHSSHLPTKQSPPPCFFASIGGDCLFRYGLLKCFARRWSTFSIRSSTARTIPSSRSTTSSAIERDRSVKILPTKESATTYVSCYMNKPSDFTSSLNTGKNRQRNYHRRKTA